jgi:uncharacterized membrane protein
MPAYVSSMQRTPAIIGNLAGAVLIHASLYPPLVVIGYSVGMSDNMKTALVITLLFLIALGGVLSLRF